MTNDRPKKRFRIADTPVYHRWKKYSQHHTFPWSGGKSIYSVTHIMAEGFQNSVLAMRASALAFKFMMAAIPGLILINTALPVLLPEEGKSILLSILGTFLPEQIFGSIVKPVSEASSGFTNGVISITALVTLYFAVNGTRASMVIFNNSYHIRENRPLLRQFGVAMVLVFILLVLACVAVPVFLLNQKVIVWLQNNYSLPAFWSGTLIFIIKYTFFFLFLAFMLSAIYYLAPAGRQKFHLLSPGSIVAAFFSVIASIVFDGFISGFTRYREVYGGISALFILMLFLFILSMIILIGFEINAALYFGKDKEPDEDPSMQNASHA